MYIKITFSYFFFAILQSDVNFKSDVFSHAYNILKKLKINEQQKTNVVMIVSCKLPHCGTCTRCRGPGQPLNLRPSGYKICASLKVAPT